MPRRLKPMKRFRKRPAHGQKQRLLGNREGSWRYAWQVVVDPGTDNNSAEREGNKYTWFTDKWSLFVNEVAGVGAAVITFDFKPVPRGKLRVRLVGFYTGNHATPQAPHLQIYNNDITDWDDISGSAFTTGGGADEIIEVDVDYNEDYWAAGTDNVRIRIVHPVVGGNPTHEFHINELSLSQLGVTSTTTTTTTSTTSTTTS